MARQLPPVDVLIIGFGWTGAIMAQELSDEGLSVLALERGAWRNTSTDFAVTSSQDEVRFRYRSELFEELSRGTLTFRNDPSQHALPMRKLGSFLPGTNVGGSGVHWNGQTWRFLPTDFVARSHNEERYGPLADGMTVQDWGITYDELEPFYDRFEYICGISGKAGNVKGEIQEGGNPFEGPRQREYPNPPMDMLYGPTLFAKAAAGLGHHPFPGPSANMSRAYTNPLGVGLAPCTYCGFCEKYACGNYSKATAQTTIIPALMRKDNFTLRTEAEVLRIVTDNTGKKATGVEYMDTEGEVWEQPADIVILAAYILANVHLLLVSKIGQPYDHYKTGKGVVGKNYAYQMTSSVNLFYDNQYFNGFVGAGACGMIIDDFNGDNFDHSGLGFIGGGYIAQWTTNARPIETHPVPEWHSKMGRGMEESGARQLSDLDNRGDARGCHEPSQ